MGSVGNGKKKKREKTNQPNFGESRKLSSTSRQQSISVLEGGNLGRLLPSVEESRRL